MTSITITNTFYDLHTPGIAREVQRAKEAVAKDERSQGLNLASIWLFNLLMDLSKNESRIEDGVRFLVEEDAQRLADSLKATGSDLSQFDYSINTEVVERFLGSKVSVETHCKPAEHDEKRLVKLLGDYCNMVEASSYVADHGKSWEPAITLSPNGEEYLLNGEEYLLALYSYQAGDRGFPAMEGDVVSLCDQMQYRIDEVRDRLMAGTTNSNPFVMAMNDENPEDTFSRYQKNKDEYPNPYEHIFFHNDVFLPKYSPGEVEMFGFPYDYLENYAQRASAEVSDYYHPDLVQSIGIEKVLSNKD